MSGCHDMREVSTAMFGSYQKPAGPDVVFPAGYTSLIKALTNELQQDKIFRRHPVVRIDYDVSSLDTTCSCLTDSGAECCGCHDNDARRKCRVVCSDEANGVELEADCVIVTTSLGFLKENAKDLFNPSLPWRKMAAINSLSIGTVDKIFLEFDNLDFLPEGVNSLLLFWGPRNKEESNDLAKTWTRKLCNIYITDWPREKLLCSKFVLLVKRSLFR